MSRAGANPAGMAQVAAVVSGHGIDCDLESQPRIPLHARWVVLESPAIRPFHPRPPS